MKQLAKEYDRVCEKLERLNERAFELEKEMMYLSQKGEKEDGKTN